MRLMDYQNEKWFEEISTFYETIYRDPLWEYFSGQLVSESNVTVDLCPRRMAIILYRDGYLTFKEVCTILQMIESFDYENEQVYISILNNKYQLYYETRLE